MAIFIEFGQPYSFEKITVGTAAVSLSKEFYFLDSLPPRKAMIQVDLGGQVRYRIDGLASVSSSVGHILNPLDSLIIDGIQAIQNFNAISVSSASSYLLTTYFR